MPNIYLNNDLPSRHTDDMQDIITAVPSWLLRWGITIFFAILVLIVGLAALIKYPDIVNATLKVDSPNSPKPVVTKISGKLVKLLVNENETVKEGQPLGYLESTANHQKVLALLTNLKELQQQMLENKPLNDERFNGADNIQFGELQSAYQVFFQEYLTYRSSIDNGFLVKKKAYLQKDLSFLGKQQQQLSAQKTIQQKDYDLAADEYNMHKKLEEERVETPAELRQEESKYLSKKSALLQTESSIITGDNTYVAKQSISTAEDWKSKYVLTAAQPGKLTFAGIIQENQVLAPGQEVFYIDPGNVGFFGEMTITQANMGKVKEGQQVLVKLRSYPFEEYGMIKGRIKYIAEVPYKDSVFISKVDFKVVNASDMRRPIHLKQGMMADAEIITQDATIMQRIGRSFFKIIGTK
jgi:hypothetical protein